MDTEKTRRLVLALEGIAILTALVLILVDYKLKNDLVDLYRKMERALADGKRILGPEFASDIDPRLLHPRDLVGDATAMETANGTGAPGVVGQNGAAKTARRTPAKRSRGNGNPAIQESDKPVGS